MVEVPERRPDATLLDILCSHTWSWDSDGESHITFDENGTGLVVARREFCLFIVAELKWMPRNQEALGQSVDTSTKYKNDQLLGTVEIEICLTKNRPPKLGRVDTNNYSMNESLLSDQAFCPKSYLLTIEKGIFTTADDAKLRGGRWIVPTYPYRLRFDRSPYPSRQEWKDPTGAPDKLKFWEWTDFCGGERLDQSVSSPQKKTILDVLQSGLKRLWH